MAGLRVDMELVASLVSLVVNLLLLFVEGLLAGRAVAGALNGARPAGAWRAGAVGAVVLWVLPILSLVTLLVSSFLLVENAARDPVPGRRDLLRLAAVRRRAGARDGAAPGAVARAPWGRASRSGARPASRPPPDRTRAERGARPLSETPARPSPA